MAVSLICGGNRSTRRKPPTSRKTLTNIFAKCCIECISPCTGFEHTTLVVIGTDYTGSFKSHNDGIYVVLEERGLHFCNFWFWTIFNSLILTRPQGQYLNSEYTIEICWTAMLNSYIWNIWTVITNHTTARLLLNFSKWHYKYQKDFTFKYISIGFWIYVCLVYILVILKAIG